MSHACFSSSLFLVEDALLKNSSTNIYETLFVGRTWSKLKKFSESFNFHSFTTEYQYLYVPALRTVSGGGLKSLLWLTNSPHTASVQTKNYSKDTKWQHRKGTSYD